MRPDRLIPLNTDGDGCAVTLTTAHHFAGNIISPRQGFREMGVIVITENRNGRVRNLVGRKETMNKERDFHRQVRVVYRALRKIYGVEKTQDEALRIFKIVFPHINIVRTSEDTEFHIPLNVVEDIKRLKSRWQAGGELRAVMDKAIDMMEMPMPWDKDKLIQFYEDILPVVMRIRKFTPYETGALMDLRREEVQKMYDAGLSNSAIYCLHGNSICAQTLYYIFKKLFIDTAPETQHGQPVQLSIF